MLQIFLLIIFTTDIVFGENNTTEKDYVPELKLISVDYLDKSLLAPNTVFKFRKVNKTQFALNVEFELLNDLDGNKLTTVSEMYVLLNNYYKFTGIRQENNVCQQWKQNLYMIRSILQKYSNIDACNIVKKRYWVKDFVLDTSMYPKSLPLGSYKGVVAVKMDRVTILQLAFYLRLNYYANWQKQSSNRLKIEVL